MFDVKTPTNLITKSRRSFVFLNSVSFFKEMMFSPLTGRLKFTPMPIISTALLPSTPPITALRNSGTFLYSLFFILFKDSDHFSFSKFSPFMYIFIYFPPFDFGSDIKQTSCV